MHFLNNRDNSDARMNQQSIRDANIRLLFQLVNRHRELSRSDLVRRSGLSPTTVSALVDGLLQEGLVMETGYAYTTQTGRKPINLRVNPSGRQIPVITIWRGGLFLSLYNLKMELIEEQTLPWEADRYGCFTKDYSGGFANAGEDYAGLILELLEKRSKYFCREKAPVLCINHPGIYIAERRCFIMSPMRVYMMQSTLEELQERLGLPIFMGKVGQSCGYAQKKYLEARGEEADDMLFVALRNGVSTGIISGGRILTGSYNFSGEIGHVSVNYRGEPCICGGRGCLERYVGLEEIARRVAQAADFHFNDLVPSRVEEVTLQQIGRAYDAGKPGIVSVLNDVAEKLYAAIYSTMCVTGVRRVYIGGGIEQLGDGFMAHMQGLMERAAAGLLTQHLQIRYGDIPFKDVGRGVAEYFIDHVFDVAGRQER